MISICVFRSPVTDSDEEDSAESSTDEEEETPNPGEEGWDLWKSIWLLLFISVEIEYVFYIYIT